MLNAKRILLLLLLAMVMAAANLTEAATVRGVIHVTGPNGGAKTGRDTGIVVWLSPLSGPAKAPAERPKSAPPKIVQKNKRFETRLLAVEAGSVVEFPNLDPFFHNVFSLFDGKRFDLGLYEAGSTRSVRFDQPGVSFIFCNIHSQMSAAVVVVNTPHFVLLTTPGEFEIRNVPPGRYQMNVWAERSSPETLKELSRQVTVTDESTVLGAIRLQESQGPASVHSNKYGKDYDPPVFSHPVYARP